MKINIRLITFLTLICTMLTLSGNGVAWEAMETKKDIQVKVEPYIRDNSISMHFETEAFDLETGTIEGTTTMRTDPFNQILFPDNTDFLFCGGLEKRIIVQNCWQGAEIAYSEEAFDNVHWNDISSLNFSTCLVLVSFDKVAVIKTCEGNYYKLGYVSEFSFIYEPLEEFRRIPLLQERKQFTFPKNP